MTFADARITQVEGEGQFDGIFKTRKHLFVFNFIETRLINLLKAKESEHNANTVLEYTEDRLLNKTPA